MSGSFAGGGGGGGGGGGRDEDDDDDDDEGDVVTNALFECPPTLQIDSGIPQ